MVKLHLIRGPVIAAIGLILVVIGAGLFDSSYQSVEYLLETKFDVMDGKQILPSQSVNSTIPAKQLKEHNVLVIHVVPPTGSVRLEGVDPNGMTFEKESKDGFLYHIIQRSNQDGSYSIKVVDTGSQAVRVDAVMGEDPFLGTKCNASDGIKCNIVQLSMGMVAVGIVAFVVGIAIGMYYFKKERDLKKK